MARFFDLPEGRNSPNAPSGERPPARLALLIGNARYPGGQLQNPINDVERLAGVLEAVGFDAKVVRNATKTTLEREIVDFGGRLEEAGRDALAFFYYAGHGIQHEGQNYLLPVDAVIPELRRLRSDALPVSFLLEELARIAGNACVVVLDACRNNPLPATTRDPRGIGVGLAPIQHVPDGTLMAYSTGAGAIAMDVDGRSRNSPYAALLAERLPQPGQLLRETFHGVAEEMRTISEGRQSPFMAVQAFPSVVLVPKPAEPAVAPASEGDGAAPGGLQPGAPAAPRRRANWVRRGLVAAGILAVALTGATAVPDAWEDLLPEPVAEAVVPAVRALPWARRWPMMPGKLNIILADLEGDVGRHLTRALEQELGAQLGAGRHDSPISVRRLHKVFNGNEADRAQQADAERKGRRLLGEYGAVLLIGGATAGDPAKRHVWLRFLTQGLEDKHTDRSQGPSTQGERTEGAEDQQADLPQGRSAKERPEGRYGFTDASRIEQKFSVDVTDVLAAHLAQRARLHLGGNRPPEALDPAFELLAGLIELRRVKLPPPPTEPHRDAALQKDAASLYWRRGQSFAARKAYDRAAADYSKAIALDPRYTLAYGDRSYARFYKGEFKAAADDMKQVVALDAGPRAVLFRFLARARAGEDAATELEANAASLRGSHWRPKVFAMREEWFATLVRLYLGDPETGGGAVAAAKTDRERCEAHFHVGERHLLRGREAEAVAALKEAAALCAPSSGVHYGTVEHPTAVVEYHAAAAELARLGSAP